MVTIVITRDLHLLIIATSLFLTHKCNRKNVKQKTKTKKTKETREKTEWIFGISFMSPKKISKTISFRYKSIKTDLVGPLFSVQIQSIESILRGRRPL